MDKAARLKAIDKAFIKLSLIDAIPMLMIGLGLHAKFGGEAEPIFAFLKNDSIVNAMFVVSVPVVVWVVVKTVKLAAEKSALGRE